MQIPKIMIKPYLESGVDTVYAPTVTFFMSSGDDEDGPVLIEMMTTLNLMTP